MIDKYILIINTQCSVKWARPWEFEGSRREPAGIYNAIVVYKRTSSLKSVNCV